MYPARAISPLPCLDRRNSLSPPPFRLIDSLLRLSSDIAYTIRVATGDQEDAGTKSQAYVVLIGNEAASEKINLDLVQEEGFAPSLTETFSVEAADVGDVMKLEIGRKLCIMCVYPRSRPIRE